ncbi:TIGR01459 family HAD-type hydrolase [Mesorhizobium sp. Z1-4]|uniref:TIGR01459 family HAD-type hydrolase n=1 Tax=Mesorhizobium sp. Z1-4 TaxID=2448478 RepID=UPI000FDC9E36|nr:TIGR01459 family HAD-type hydrolase [Mesorhizobium sp. Z1-4]
MTASLPRKIDALADISGDYDVILCDVWGVLHNGVEAALPAAAALERARVDGKIVVLVTNAPRLKREVEAGLDALGVPRAAWDRLVTSGDVTRDLIAEGARRVYHLGADRDIMLFDGLDIELVEEFEAQSVVCTGLFDDEAEAPDDYAEALRRMRARDLPFVCANPDIVVERGDRLIWCAGALARDYAQLGGRTLIAGKPHKPIYDAALKAAADTAGHELVDPRVLAIGDGILTDIKGASAAGYDALFITAGIHAAEYGGGDPAPASLSAFLTAHGLWPRATMPRLR